MTAHPIEPEFSRRFPVERLGFEEVVESLEADAAERAALARRFGLPRLDQLAALVRLSRQPGDLIRVNGRLEAELVQTCVVTLEPFPSHVEDSFDVLFAEGVEALPQDVLLDPEDEGPEPIADGTIDIGELVAQFLSLALDPHPRAPGVALDQVWSPGDGSPQSPFAVLEALKRRD
jgi:uncharacterized metal-binding protein YceD (DUF177 family)